MLQRYFSQDKYVKTLVADTNKLLNRRKIKQYRGTAKKKEGKCHKRSKRIGKEQT